MDFKELVYGPAWSPFFGSAVGVEGEADPNRPPPKPPKAGYGDRGRRIRVSIAPCVWPIREGRIILYWPNYHDGTLPVDWGYGPIRVRLRNEE